MPYISEKMLASMDAHVKKVRGLVEKAEKSVEPYFGGIFDTSAEEQVRPWAARARVWFTDWADATRTDGKYRWALAGKRPDGKAYTTQEWFSFGDEIGSLASEVMGSYYQSGVAWQAAQTADAVETELGRGADELGDWLKEKADLPSLEPSPGWKVALAVGGGVLLMGVTAYAVREARILVRGES